jgi:hypothetical protein
MRCRWQIQRRFGVENLKLSFVLMLFMITPVAGQTGSSSDPGESAQSNPIELGDSGVTLKVPASWKKKPATSSMIQYEFAAGNSLDGPVRITMMAAGGGVEANIERWRKQFVAVDGEPAVANQAVNPQRQIAGKTIHVADFSGTYLEQMRGPMGPSEKKSGYRMLAAIVELGNGAHYFVKLYGPAAAVAKEQQAFDALLSSIGSK